jgi:cytochrome b561
MNLRNSATQWGALAKGFHWLGAVLTIFLVSFGWWMIHVAERAERLANFGIHASIGYDLLLLIALRLCWRAIDRGPALPADLLRWEKGAAHLGHFLLYFLLLAVSVTGWMIVSSARRPIDASLLGFIPVPLLDRAGDKAFHDLAEDVHRWLSYSLLVLIIVHIAAALHHHYGKKNDILRRML